MVPGILQWILEARLKMSGDRIEMTYNSGLQLDFNQGHCNYTVNVLKPTGHHAGSYRVRSTVCDWTQEFLTARQGSWDICCFSSC